MTKPLSTAENLVRLAALVRNDRKALNECCALARTMKLRSPKKSAPAANGKPSTTTKQRKDFFNQFSRTDLIGGIAQFGGPRISNLMLTDYITQKANEKFAQMKGAK